MSFIMNWGMSNWIVSWSVKMKGDSMVRASKRSGWLQTFLSYISTLMIEKKSLSARMFLVLSVLIYSSYRSLCLLVSEHYTMCSIFSGSCFSTSLFILLRMKGRRMLWSFWTTLKFKLLFWLILCENGLLNHSLKSCILLKICGIRKCMRLQSSMTSFWSGVPVRRSLRLVLKRNRVYHL